MWSEVHVPRRISDGHKPNFNKPTQAQMLKALATVEHSKKLEEVKSNFMSRANEAATLQKFTITLYDANKWTDRVRNEFMSWLRTEGFKCDYRNDGRGYYELFISWE